MAEPAFYCKSKANENFANYGSVDRYIGCGESCDCSIFELLCLRRDPDFEGVFTLESESFAYADKCLPTECLCNNNQGGWEKFSGGGNGEPPLPSAQMFPLPSYSTLEEIAKSDEVDQKSYFYRYLYVELQKPHTRTDTVVHHYTN